MQDCDPPECSRGLEMTQLIQEVRSRPAIWDSRSEQYRDVLIKDKAWDDIAETLCKDKNTLRHQWKKLKDCHRQAMNRRKAASGLGAAKIKKWKYEDEMKFVLGTSAHIMNDSNAQFLHQNDDQGSNYEDQQQNLTDEQEDEYEEMESNGEPEDVEAVEAMITLGEGRRHRPSRDAFKSYHLTHNKERRRKPAENVPDEIDLFFASAALSVRKLPRRLQNRVKIELLNSICRAEEEEELNFSSATGASTHAFGQTASPTSMHCQPSSALSSTRP